MPLLAAGVRARPVPDSASRVLAQGQEAVQGAVRAAGAPLRMREGRPRGVPPEPRPSIRQPSAVPGRKPFLMPETS